MCKSDSSSANCPPVLSLSKIAPQPDLDTLDLDGIYIGLNESSILFIHHKISIFPPGKLSSFCQNFLLANLSARILSRSNDL